MIHWSSATDAIDWSELSELYRLAPLGNKSPDWLQTAFGNSRFRFFARENDVLIAAGRAVADGVDCSYICDIAVHPSHQGRGLGREVIERLVAASRGHRKIILYAVPGKEDFYRRFGFRRMKTAMAIFEDADAAARNGYTDEA
jgi:ribosomal protein S18 acetylase RimI-like enzyme